MAKQQSEIKKGRPRGRPWPPGVSGNPRGRPKGSRNKWTLAVMAANRPVTMDQSRPFTVLGDRYVQFGRAFRKDTLEEINPGSPTPVQPDVLDRQKHCIEIIWQGRRCYLQNGWLYDWATWKVVKS